MRLIPLIALISISSLDILKPLNADAKYWLVMGSYRQGPGGRPEVSGITSPSIFAIPMDSLNQCQIAGKKIEREIYKPVWQFDNRWTCVDGAE